MPAPGDKLARRRSLARQQRYGDNRRAWLETYQNRLTLYTTAGDDPEINEEGLQAGDEAVTVMMQRIGSKSRFMLNLSALTHDELCAIKEFFDMAFANAQGVTQARDKEAQEAFDAGDTSYNRIYRQVPIIFVREGEVFGHRAKLLRGSDWVARVESFIKVIGTKLRTSSSVVPQRPPAGTEGSGTADDDEATG